MDIKCRACKDVMIMPAYRGRLICEECHNVEHEIWQKQLHANAEIVVSKDKRIADLEAQLAEAEIKIAHLETDCGCYLCNGVTGFQQDYTYMCDTCKTEQLAHKDKVIAVLAEDVAALKNQYEFEDTTPEYESELAEAKAKEG